jgi:hypothetical protein
MVCVCKAVVTTGEVDSLRVACDMYILMMMMMMMMLCCTAIVREVGGFVFGIHWTFWARGYCGYCGP